MSERYDKIIEEAAKEHMIQFNLPLFKQSHPSLYNTIIKAMSEVQGSRIELGVFSGTQITIEKKGMEPVIFRTEENVEILQRFGVRRIKTKNNIVNGEHNGVDFTNILVTRNKYVKQQILDFLEKLNLDG